MRARFEPTINVSERVSLISMIDVLDNVGFGTNPATYPFDSTGSNGGTTPLNILQRPSAIARRQRQRRRR